MKKILITILIAIYYCMNTFAYAEITVNTQVANSTGLKFSGNSSDPEEYSGLKRTDSNLTYAVQNITSYFVSMLYIYAIVRGNYKVIPLIFIASSFVQFTASALSTRSYYY